MGAVFEVYDNERETSVALKTLRHPSPQFLLFLKREFRILQGIHHHNLVRLGELIEEEGQWFFTMELIDGFDFVSHSWGARRGALHARGKAKPRMDADTETAVGPTADNGDGNGAGKRAAKANTLAFGANETTVPGRSDLLAAQDARRPAAFEPSRLRASVLGVAEGLMALHDAGVVHRDIKPSNVMISDNGRVVLLDFGLAHQTTNRTSNTESSIVGTPDYMSPEQLFGAAVTPASDWYSAGATLYESLTGHPPAVMRRRTQSRGERQPLPTPSSLVDGVPADLEEVCLGLLQLAPSDRLTGAQVCAILEAADASARSSSPRPSPMIGARSVGRSISRFIGRTTELDALRRAMIKTRTGVPMVSFIEGASGIGKTALVRRFLDELSPSSTVILAGRCYERESVPFNAFDSLMDELSSWMSHLAPDERKRLIPKKIGALAQLFPVLDQSDRADLPASARSAPVELRLQAFEALRTLFGNIAETRDIVLFIDDLHWADSDSRVLLRELLCHEHAPPLFLVATYPADHQDDASVAATHQLLAAGGVEADRISLEPLTREDTRTLIEALCREVDPELLPLAKELGASAHGSPFFLEQLVRHVAVHRDASLPPTLEGADILAQMVLARVGDLPSQTAALLRTAAVIARPIDRGALLRIVDLEKGVGSLAIDALIDLRMLRSSQSGEVEAYHERLRAPVAQSVDAETARQIFERIAHLVDSEDWDATRWLGIDILRETAPERALAFARQAADTAAHACAFERAAELYGSAAELATGEERRRLARRHADMLAFAGFALRAAEAYVALIDEDRVEEARDLRRLAADNYLRGGHIAKGLACFTEVASHLGVRLRTNRLGILLSLARDRVRITIRGLKYTSIPAASCDPKELARLDTLFKSATSLGIVDPLCGLQIQGEHLLAALSVGEDVRVCRALASEAVFLASLGKRSAARGEALASEVLAKSELLGDPYAGAAASIALGFVRFFRGEYRSAIKTYEKALARLDEVPDAWWERAQIRYWHHMALVSVGNFNRLADSVPAAVSEAERRNDVHIGSLFRGHPMVWYLLRDDEPSRAMDEVARGIAPFPAGTTFQAHYVEMVCKAMVHLYDGKPGEAKATLDRGQPILKRLLIHRMPLIVGEVHKLYGWCGLQSGDTALVQRSLKRLDGLSLDIGRAFAFSFRGALAQRANDIDKSRRHLLAALRFFDETGAEHDAAACRFRLGKLLGGGRGDELVAQAEVWLAAQHVRNPQRMLGFLAPGYGPME